MLHSEDSERPTHFPPGAPTGRPMMGPSVMYLLFLTWMGRAEEGDDRAAALGTHMELKVGQLRKEKVYSPFSGCLFVFAII